MIKFNKREKLSLLSTILDDYYNQLALNDDIYNMLSQFIQDEIILVNKKNASKKKVVLTKDESVEID